MKTAEEKASEWLDDNMPAPHDDDVASLAILIKEQDRDTRHACAEAVMRVKSKYADFSIEVCWKDEAHDACMNTKAV